MKRTRSATPIKNLWAQAQALVERGCSEKEGHPLLLQEDYTASQRYRILALVREIRQHGPIQKPTGCATSINAD